MHAKSIVHGDIKSLNVLVNEGGHAQVSGGALPYEHVFDNDIMIRMVREGKRPPRPDSCSSPMWELMEACWHREPANRISMQEAVARLSSLQVTGQTGPTPKFEMASVVDSAYGSVYLGDQRTASPQRQHPTPAAIATPPSAREVPDVKVITLAAKPPSATTSWVLPPKELLNPKGKKTYPGDYVLPTDFRPEFAGEIKDLLSIYEDQKFSFGGFDDILCAVFGLIPLFGPIGIHYYQKSKIEADMLKGWSQFFENARYIGWTVIESATEPPVLCKLEKGGIHVEFQAKWRKIRAKERAATWDRIQHPDLLEEPVCLPKIVVTRASKS
ncbi:hypothetical protein HDV00_005715 [Rhizophlyctis rosea]|nr:hypothetical protein HDV00_005715 [Rhizophlyctis rosea]